MNIGRTFTLTNVASTCKMKMNKTKHFERGRSVIQGKSPVNVY